MFYSLPVNAGIFKYYVEHLRDFLIAGGDPTVGAKKQSEDDETPVFRPVITALYSKFNAFELERICGTEAAKEMLSKHNKVSIVEF